MIQIAQSKIFIEQEITENRKLRLLSLYLDFAASIRARWATSQIIKIAGQHWQSSLEMWKFDSLAVSEPIRKMVTKDAANADVIVIAVSSLKQRPSELIDWLDSLKELKPNRSVSALLSHGHLH